MVIRRLVQKFIEEQFSLIDLGDWEAVYNKFYMDYAEDFKDIGNLSDALIAAEINPLDGVDKVYKFMFCESEQSKIIIPEGIRYIDQEAFSKTSDLREVYIPKSVTQIKFRAFKQAGLQPLPVIIIYSGTRDEWLEIYKESGWDYETRMIIRCLGDEK